MCFRDNGRIEIDFNAMGHSSSVVESDASDVAENVVFMRPI